MACDVTTLVSNASCFNCVSPGMWQLLRLAILCRISQGNTMSCDVQTLLGEASCFQCLTPGEMQLAELSLLCSIATGGSSGGGGGISSGVIDPVAAPTDPTVDNIYFNIANLNAITEWLWPAGGAGWSQVV